jgi:hypothetical protein
LQQNTSTMQQRAQQRNQDMMLQLSAARTQARTAAAAAAEQFKQDRQLLQEQTAAAAQAAAKARAVQQAACRDEAAVLAALTHIGSQQMVEREELAQIKQQLAATQKEATQAGALATQLRQQLDTATAAGEAAQAAAVRAELLHAIAQRHNSNLHAAHIRLQELVEGQSALRAEAEERRQLELRAVAAGKARAEAEVALLKKRLGRMQQQALGDMQAAASKVSTAQGSGGQGLASSHVPAPGT